MMTRGRYKIRYQVEELPPLQLLADARFVLSKLKAKTKFTVSKCLRKHPHLLSTSQFKSRHAAKFLQPYGTQLSLFKSIVKPGPRLVLLRSPPDTGKTSLAPSLPELFPDNRSVFCCLARRVNLEVAQTLYNNGTPFAWCHNKQITCSWLCGLRGASTSNSVAQMEEKLRLGVERLQQEAALRAKESALGPGAVLKAESVTTPQAKFTNSDFNARLLGLDPKSPYVTQRPNQNYFWYSTGEAQVERRDPGIQLATVDESLSCDAFRESAWVDANRPEWPPALRTKLAAYAAAEPRVDFVMPPKGSPPSKGELVF